MAQSSSDRSTPRITPFTVHIADDDLQHLDALLRMTPMAQPTYETSLPGGDRSFGMRQDWLKQAVWEWKNTFDWRKHEAYMNTFNHFHTNIEDDLGDFHIHYVAMYSKRPDAVPLLLLHGWPGSFLEFLPMLDKLRNKYNPDDLPYHLVVPSLPGYAFSSPPPLDRDFVIEDVARLMNRLMLNLGYGAGYTVQGGDVGSKVARVMAVKHEECKAIHINFCIMEDEPEQLGDDVSEAEHKGLDRAREFLRTGSSYAIQHATKPATISLVLSSNPVALLAWIGEKFLAWTEEDPPTSLILESFYTPGVNGNPHNMSKYKIPEFKPFGYSYYPYELYPVPKSWAATTGNLTFFRSHEKGGHFATIEQTDTFLNDLEEFVQESRGAAGFAHSD
ncbi:alpha/beta-hydrolase, partial [Aureobasidium melanogenum]